MLGELVEQLLAGVNADAGPKAHVGQRKRLRPRPAAQIHRHRARPDAEILKYLPLACRRSLQVTTEHPRVVACEEVLIVRAGGGHRPAKYAAHCPPPAALLPRCEPPQRQPPEGPEDA